MVQAIKIFIDSSILIEFVKGTNTELFEKLLHSNNKLFANSIVYSEFMFHYLALLGNKSPLAIKEKKQIPQLLGENNPMDLFSVIEMLPSNTLDTMISYELMKKYNLLPNDALIFASLTQHNINHLASYDRKDFEHPCKIENIKLISSVDDNI